MIEIDDTDRRLIALLREDGRRNNRYLSKRLGISRVTTRKRVSRLMQEGAIRISVTIDPTMGHKPVGVIIGLKVLKKELDHVIDDLATHFPVIRVAKTHGRFNIIALATFIDIYEMSNYMVNTVTKIEGVVTGETFFILHRRDTDQKQQGEIDEIDRSIIGVLREDGRQSATAISKRLGLSVATAQRRMKRLIDEGWIRVVALIDQKQVDWYWPAIVGISVKRSHLLDVLDQVSKHPNIGPAFCTLGSFDIMADIRDAESIDRLYGIVEEDLSQIEGVNGCYLFIISGSKSGLRWWL